MKATIITSSHTIEIGKELINIFYDHTSSQMTISRGQDESVLLQLRNYRMNTNPINIIDTAIRYNQMFEELERKRIQNLGKDFNDTVI